MRTTSLPCRSHSTRRPLWRAVAGSLLLALGVQAQAALFEDDEARAQIRALSARVDQLQGSIETRLGSLETAVRSQAALDLISQLEQTRADLAKTRGQLEVILHDLEQLQKRQRDLYVDLDSRLRRLEAMPKSEPRAEVPPGAGVAGSAAAPGAPGSGAASETAAPSPPAGLPPPSVIADPRLGPPKSAAAQEGQKTASAAGSGAAAASAPSGGDLLAEQRAYDAALDLFRAGNYAGAADAFQAFVKTYPKSALAPSAQYWVGNAQYARRDYKAAIATQRQLISSYPDSPKVPDALLNIASCQAELGERTAARRTLEELVAKYPNSDAARAAKQRLAAKG